MLEIVNICNTMLIFNLKLYLKYCHQYLFGLFYLFIYLKMPFKGKYGFYKNFRMNRSFDTFSQALNTENNIDKDFQNCDSF